MPLRRALERPVLLFLLASAAVFAADAWVVASGRLRETPLLQTLVVTADYAVALPALYWWLVVRRGGARVTTILPVVALGIVLAALVLPSGDAERVALLRWLLVGAELVLITTGVRRAVVAARESRGAAAALPAADFYDHLRGQLGRMVGVRAVGESMAAELVLVHYAISGWFKGTPVPRHGRAFTYHRASSMATIIGALVGISAVEIPVVHILLANWSTVAAWIATGLGVFGVVWGLGTYQAMRLRPIVVTDDTLVLRLGVLAQARIPLSTITRVERARFPYPARETAGYVSLAAMGDLSLLITTAEPVPIERMYGRRTAATTIGVIADQPDDLQRALGVDPRV